MTKHKMLPKEDAQIKRERANSSGRATVILPIEALPNFIANRGVGALKFLDAIEHSECRGFTTANTVTPHTNGGAE